jgi:transposase
MQAEYHRHDISDEIWALLEPLLVGQAGQRGGIAKDNRQFLNAVFWVLRTGAPWRDLPPDYGDWKNAHRRFAAGAKRVGGKPGKKPWRKTPIMNGS